MSCERQHVSEDLKQVLGLTHDLLLQVVYFRICIIDNFVHATAQVCVFISHNLAKVLLVCATTGQAFAIQVE
jgi:hypothetical protein